MRVLAFDAGAKRMGWACLEGDGVLPPIYVDSGIAELVKLDDEKDQEYRLRLIRFWSRQGYEMLERFGPQVVVTETLPLFGGDGFSQNVQGKLAASAVTALQTVCYIYGTDVKQVAAISVKARVGGTKKATKVAVRNGVIKLIPELASRKSDWVKVFDEPDALGVGLVFLGYSAR